MSKTQITLAAIGGAGALAVIGAAAFAFMALDSKATCEEELQETIDEARKYLNQEIPPCEASKAAIDDSCEQVKLWREEAFKLAARGDRPLATMSVAQFKEFMISESHRLGALPQTSTNKIVDATFEFGPFKPYISEGKMPEEAELNKLMREFDDTVTIIETLAGAGVRRVKAFDLDDRTAAPKVEVTENTGRRGRKGKAQPSKKASQEPETFKPATHTYRVICLTTPEAFVKALNAFATIDRFAVVDNFTLALERDAIATALGGGDAKKEEGTSSRRSRRRAAVVEEEKPAEEGAEAPKVTPVTDPATDSVFEAVMTISIHDFKTLEAAEPAAKEEEAE